MRLMGADELVDHFAALPLRRALMPDRVTVEEP